MKRILLLLLTIGWGLGGLRAADGKPAGAADVIARGKSFEVRRGELEEAFERHERELLNTGRMVSDDDRPKVLSAILDRLVFVKLVMSRATDADKVIGEAAAKKTISEIKARTATDSAYKRLLQRAGLDEESFVRLKVEEQTVLAVLDRELKSRITVSDEAVAKYYSAAPDRWERPEMIKVAHLLIATREPNTGRELSEEQKKEKRRIADALLEKAKSGTDFATLVKQNSEDAATRGNGGELTLARGQMVIEFETVATALKPGQISDIVTTQYGYHIIKGIEFKPAAKLTLAEVSKDIRDLLLQKEFEKQVPEFTERLKKEAAVEFPPAAGAAK